jgi:hypothetical protein
LSALLPDPDHLSPSQRAREITRILAGALRRLHPESAREKEPVGLGCLPHQRGGRRSDECFQDATPAATMQTRI